MDTSEDKAYERYPTDDVQGTNTEENLYGRGTACLLALDAPPLHGNRPQHADGSHDHGDAKGPDQRVVVRNQDVGKIRRIHELSQISGAGVQDCGRVDAVEVQRQHVRQQPVREDVLRDGNEDGPAEDLHEDDQGRADGDVVEREHGLRGYWTLLEA